MFIYKKYFPKFRIPFLVAVTCVALEAFCDLLGPTLMARVVNNGIINSDMDAVLHWSLIMLIVVFIGACLAVTRSIVAARTSSHFGADLRRDVFTKIMSFSEESADKIQSGSLITRMTGDTSQVVMFANGIMRIFIKAPIACAGSIIFATILNPRLSLCIYAVVAVIAVLTVISIKMSYIRFAKLQAALDKVNSVTQEYLLGVRLVKAFGTYKEEEDRFDGANETLKKRAMSTEMVITVISPIMGLVVGLGITLAIYFGSILFGFELIEPGDIAAFVAYMNQMLMSLMMITNIFNVLVRAKASANRIREVMESEEESKMLYSDSQVASSANGCNGSLAFENVTFTYPGSNIPSIKDLSFSITPGETLAVIGSTGSGKTTLCWLILRFFDTDSGSIFLGGHNINALPVDSVRENISIAPQNPLLFSGTVKENIRWGKQDSTDEAVYKAASQVQAAGFIDDMQHGYDSILGRGGVNISGGQKQRISMARAIIRNAPLLLIDDATSALDSLTEAKVRTELLLYPGTKVIITQRCTAAMHADKILVLEKGSCAGFGSHTELINDCEVYKMIWQSQVDSKGVAG